ncbi:hypothetical protein DSECCO2_647670 [anaerobic digester metagenome]
MNVDGGHHIFSILRKNIGFVINRNPVLSRDALHQSFPVSTAQFLFIGPFDSYGEIVAYIANGTFCEKSERHFAAVVLHYNKPAPVSACIEDRE